MNMKSWRFWVVVASISGAAAVGVGAYGYHSLSGDDKLREVLATAVQYHMFHTLALFAASWMIANRPERSAYWAVRASWSFVGGIGLFSGSLYSYTLGNAEPVGAAAPIGGMLFMSGWLMLAWSAVRKTD